MQMRVLSAPKVQRYAPTGDEVLISIRSPGDPAPRLKDGWRAVLSVVFADTGPYAAPHAGQAGLTREIAYDILDFVEAHRACRRMTIQCHAGVSRSRSLAAVLADLFALPYKWTAVNPDVVRVVREAAGSRPIGYGGPEARGENL
jgi:predicted protein tyrosine phosphatase